MGVVLMCDTGFVALACDERRARKTVKPMITPAAAAQLPAMIAT